VTPTVALFGASVRWLAQSAKRAGFRVLACDLFGDEDLREAAEVRTILRSEYPHGFMKIADEWTGVPRVYTGGLENHPDVVEHLERTGPLWGCRSEVLKRCRAPTALIELGIPTPEVRLDADGVPTNGRWLQKPIKGSGGFDVKRWRGGSLPKDCFLQRYIEGEPVSASFLALPNRTVLIGASRQFVGESWTGATEFAFAGGMAPIRLGAEEKASLLKVGESLRRMFGLQGLLGVDAIRNNGKWTFIEINPRPTASMELLEIVSGKSLFNDRRSAFLERANADGDALQKTSPLVGEVASLSEPVGGADAGQSAAFPCTAGKAIFFAERECRLTEPLPTELNSVRFADRPSAGSTFSKGDPIATVIATGDDEESVLCALKDGVQALRSMVTGV
jgi:predicted ATP-grasp superfamily ATP-dependent carboligase